MKNKTKWPASVRARVDSWVNLLTGIGGSRDKSVAATFATPDPIDAQTLVDLYRGNDIARKIVDKIPEEMFRSGYEVKHPEAERLQEAWKALTDFRLRSADTLIREALSYGRLFGLSAIWIGADDRGLSEDPLDKARVKSPIRFLRVLDRRELSPSADLDLDPASPGYGEPLFWTYYPQVGGQSIKLHRTRLLFFGGAPVPFRERASASGGLSYSDDSVLQAPYDVLRAEGQTWASVANTLTDAGQAVFRMSGLMDLIARGQGSTLNDRMSTLDMTRSVARMMVLDKENEDFTRETYSFSGYGEILSRLMERLAAAADMPLTILFGVSPAGLNATGESDIRLFYDRVRQKQLEILEPRLRFLYTLVALSVGIDPTGLEISFPPLWQPGPVEAENLRKTEIDRLIAGIGEGLYTLEEARAYLVGKEGHPEQIDGAGDPPWAKVAEYVASRATQS